MHGLHWPEARNDRGFRGETERLDGAAMGGRLGSRLSGLGLDEGASLPSRLQGLSELPWFECWVQRLKTEKKSVHTIRAYTVAARTLSTTSMPGEEALDWEQAKSLSVLEIHGRIDPNRGRFDSWLNSIGDLKPATINALSLIHI